MFRSRYQEKLIALLVLLVVCLAAVIILMASARTNSPVVTQVAPTGVAQVANVPAQCNPLFTALGGCK